MNFSEIVLRTKRDKTQEYTLHLFEKCNMACNFCWQDHTAYVGVDTVREKIPLLCEMLQADKKEAFDINIMGGEIFSDDLFTEKMWHDYYDLCWETHCFVREKLNKQITFNFVTNLVNNKVPEMKDLIDKLRAQGVTTKLSTSYDAKGRFTKTQFELFKINVELMRDYISGFSMLLTKPVINNILAGKDDYFKYLYNEGFYIYFDYYTPGTDAILVGPSDKELLRMFYFLVDNYPKVSPIREWIQNHTNVMSCRSSKLLLPDGTTCMCGNLTVAENKVVTFFKSKIQRANNDDIEESLLNRWDCMSCEYFNRCTLGCFMQQIGRAHV